MKVNSLILFITKSSSSGLIGGGGGFGVGFSLGNQ